ncbi:MAG: hypothetical protein F6K19_05370 [Cyanothece sp. SIO1E1]|nr:hypothetical protein [Cyanothece sp. SIO1E1]
MKHTPSRNGPNSPTKYLLAGGSMLALVGFLVDPYSLFKRESTVDICQEIVQPQAVLSRERLSQLLSIPERDHKAAVREIVQEPYCQLPSLEVRAGVRAEREAYPLAFDPETWFVILYEGEEYAGYAFSFRH